MSGVVYPPENVYNLIPKDERQTEKPPRYVSKFRPMVIHETKSTKDAMRMMGPAKVEVPSPEKYLKKHSKEPTLPDKTQCSKDVCNTCTCTGRKPAVPAKTDNPPMGIRTKRDFIKTTVVVPMKPQPISVDSKNGHKQLLENSGLVPKYTKKKDYGEVPQYLLQRIEEERRAQEEYDNFVREQREQQAMKCLSDEEQQAILENLKRNWDKLHQEYQSLPLFTDTLSDKANKDQLEKAMKQLEKDISYLERFKTIYIPNN